MTAMEKVLQGLTVAMKFHSWEMTQVTSANSLLAITSYMTLSNGKKVC